MDKKLKTLDSYENVQDFNWALGLNRLSLRLMGVWPDDIDNNERSLFIFLRVPFMIFSMFLCLFLPQMYALVLVINELPLVIDNLMTSCAAFTSCIKLYFIWRSKKESIKASDTISDERLAVSQAALGIDDHEKEASRARIFTISGYIVLGGCYAGFAFAPLFGFNIRMISNITDYGGRYLLVQSYFPYDYSKSPNFELTHISQLISGFFIGMCVSIPDNYFGALVFHATAQFEILGYHIENFIQDDKSFKGYKNRNFNRELGKYVDRHVHLLTMVSAIGQSFSFIILAQIFCMCVMVVCLGFQILGMFDDSANKTSFFQMLVLMSTLFTLMMHTLVDCFACENLTMRSAGIFSNIYNCKWYLVPEQSTEDLIPMMVASKIPRQLTAGKMFCLSLATYCSILKSSLGYISMLIAVNRR